MAAILDFAVFLIKPSMKDFHFCWKMIREIPSTSSTKYHYFLMYRTKVTRKRTMVTDVPAQLTVYIHPKTLRLLALFWMGRVSRICWLWKNHSLEKVDIYTQKKLFFRGFKMTPKWNVCVTCVSCNSRLV